MIYRPDIPIVALSYLNTVSMVPPHTSLTHNRLQGTYHTLRSVLMTLFSLVRAPGRVRDVRTRDISIKYVYGCLVIP